MNYAPQSLLRPKQLFFDIYYILVSNLPRKEPYGFFLADTILFLENAPILWLFTSRKDMTIKKKNSSRLNIKNILEKISSKENGEIVAYYMNGCDDEYKEPVHVYSSKEESEKNALLNEFFEKIGVDIENNTKIFKKSQLLFEYFTKEELKDFLLNKKKKQGVLQFYIKQTTLINTMSRIIYNEKISICEVRRSRQPDNKKTPHAYEKIITFETDKFHITSENVKSKLLEAILKNAAKQIVKRIEQFYHNKIKIKSIILHFKENADKLIYLQFCTGVSFIEYEDDKRKLALWLGHEFKCELNESFLTNIYKSFYSEKDKKNILTAKCLNCNQNSLYTNFYKIPISYLIDYHNFLRTLPNSYQINSGNNDFFSYVKAILIKEYKEQIHELQNKEDSFKDNIGLKRSEMSDVPLALKRLELESYGDINYDIYTHLKNPEFKNTKIKVCGDCYPKLINLDLKISKPNSTNNMVIPIKKINNKFITNKDVFIEKLKRNVKSSDEDTFRKTINRSSSFRINIPLLKVGKNSTRSILQQSVNKLLVKRIKKEDVKYDSNKSVNSSQTKTNSFNLPLDRILRIKKDDTKLSLSNRNTSTILSSKTSARSSAKSLMKCASNISYFKY